MKMKTKSCLSLFIALLLLLNTLSVQGFADEVTDSDVLTVIEQLESIDTLQQIQNNRSKYAVKSRYRADTTDMTIINAHNASRATYETYVAEMFAARLAAQQAYDALTDAQKAQIDPALVAKLSNELPTNFRIDTFNVTPRSDTYSFEAVANNTSGGLCYEVSSYVTLGPEIPALFILVDTADGKTTWTPSGRYEPGVSNFEVNYCCDLDTGLEYGSHYKRVNLEDSTYFSEGCAEKIRAIVTNSYPYISMDEMRARLKAAGMSAEVADALNRSDMIAATQMAVWAYANTDSPHLPVNQRYAATFDINSCKTAYMNPLHDHTNEMWEYWTTSSKQYTYNAESEYRVHLLLWYLCNLDPVPASKSSIAVSSVEVTRADIEPGSNGVYRVGMYINLDNAGTQSDRLKINVTSSHVDASGNTVVTGKTAQYVDGNTRIPMSVNAVPGDTIRVTIDGTQELPGDVYFYEPEGGRGTSQSLVGYGRGMTTVHAETEFEFNEEPGEMGLRIYKTNSKNGKPISDITFHIYNVVPEEGSPIQSATPTPEEVAKYAVPENKIASLVTDSTGYAGVSLEKGIYMVVEEKHPDILEPVSPFYVFVPMFVEDTDAEGNTITKELKIVSIYPKNEPNEPPVPPPPPPPEDLKGNFQIYKYDSEDKDLGLAGAEFMVYRAVKPTDPEGIETVTLLHEGTKYAVTPVHTANGPLVLTTNDAGYAVSPQLSPDLYFVVETTAPKGYNLTEDIFTVTVLPDTMVTATQTLEVPNSRGSILPETGGIGTSIFTVTGSILALTAIALLIMKKKQDIYFSE